MDTADERIQLNTKRVDILYNKSKDTGCCCIMLILLVCIVVLALWKLF